MGADLYQQVHDELKPDERLIWLGFCLSQRRK
jgi:hypothetical protein